MRTLALAGRDAIVATRANPNSRRKSDGSWVSDADLRAQEAVAFAAQELLPGVPIHSEERLLADWIEKEQVVVVDPLDGTSNFLRGLPAWSTSVALVREGRPVAGAVASSTGEIFWATQRGGAYRSTTAQPSADVERLAVARRSLKAAVVCLGFDPQSADSTARWLAWTRALRPPAVEGVRVLESGALSLCWVAAGAFDAYLNPTDREWDMAAGALIAQEAGARLSSPDHQPWHLRDRGVIASSAAAWPALEDLLVQRGEARQ